MKRNVCVSMVSWFLLLAGLGALGYFLILLIFLGPGASFIGFWAVLGGVLLALRFAIERLKNERVKGRLCAVLAAVIAVGLACVIGVESVIIAGGMARPAPDADYMLVLGARVKDTGPSVLLNYRIDKAFEYLQANERTVAILCGGQGSDEPMSEAQAMYEALVARGIAPERLIREEQSTSTEENIRLAMAFMDDPGDSVVITTTHYHVYRAMMTARAAGLENVSGNGAPCAVYTLVNYYTREFFAVMYNWIFA